MTEEVIGTLVGGRYRVNRLLGKGGMGAVYVAEQIAMGRMVALKMLRPDLADSPSLAARFQREARAASAISSPHVVTVFDFGAADDGTLYLAMELLKGRTVGARIAEGPIEVVEAVRIARSVAAALEAAHGAGVVHRDLKPDNIFLTDDGNVKVLDFGLAKIMDGRPDPRSALTAAGAILGTPPYMAPELIERGGVHHSADLYALGIILFEMLTGEPAFFDKNPIVILGMHLRVPPPTIASRRPDLKVPPRLEELCQVLMAKAPEERMPDALSVRIALDEIGADAAALARGLIPFVPIAAPLRGAAAPGERHRRPAPPEPSAPPPEPEVDPAATVRNAPPLGTVAVEAGAPASDVTGPMSPAGRDAWRSVNPAPSAPPTPPAAAPPPAAQYGAGPYGMATANTFGAGAPPPPAGAAYVPTATPRVVDPATPLPGTVHRASPPVWPLVMGGVLAVAGVLALVLVVALRGGDEGIAAAAPPHAVPGVPPPSLPVVPPPAPIPPPPVPPSESPEITLELRVTPSEATVRVDGTEHPNGPPISLPRSDREHTIEISAEGYVSRELHARGDRDATYEIVLERAPRPRKRTRLLTEF